MNSPRERAKASLAASFMMLFAACAKPAPDPILPAPPAVVKPGTTLSASPDPILTDNGYGETTLTWSTTARHTQLRVGTPEGPPTGGGGSSGTLRTGPWVTNGMTFYLQDADAPDPASPAATLGSIAIAVQ